MRRKKEDSEITRQKIIDAGRDVFAQRGVCRTTFEQIASQADLTRGAIYWHFKDKSELFFAMKDQMAVPLMDRGYLLLLDPNTNDPLISIQNFLKSIVNAIASDEMTRKTLEIVLFKCEYVDEFKSVLNGQENHYAEMCEKLTQAYERADEKRLLQTNLLPKIAAIETAAFLIGFIRMWMIDSEGNVVRDKVNEVIENHINAKRAK